MSIFKKSNSRASQHLILKFNLSEDNTKSFGLVISGKFSKKAVIRNKVRRFIAESIRLRLDSIPGGKFIFIPKKNILDENGKIKTDAKTISAEVNTLLSKMDIA